MQPEIMYFKTMLLSEILLHISDLVHSHITEEILELLRSARIFVPVACNTAKTNISSDYKEAALLRTRNTYELQRQLPKHAASFA